MRKYTEKRSVQLTYNDKQSHSGGSKRGKTVKFKNNTEEVNITKSHDEPIPINKKGKM